MYAFSWISVGVYQISICPSTKIQLQFRRKKTFLHHAIKFQRIRFRSWDAFKQIDCLEVTRKTSNRRSKQTTQRIEQWNREPEELRNEWISLRHNLNYKILRMHTTHKDITLTTPWANPGSDLVIQKLTLELRGKIKIWL